MTTIVGDFAGSFGDVAPRCRVGVDGDAGSRAAFVIKLISLRLRARRDIKRARDSKNNDCCRLSR